MPITLIAAVCIAAPLGYAAGDSVTQPPIPRQVEPVRDSARDLVLRYIEAMNAPRSDAIREFELAHRSSGALAVRSMSERVAQAAELKEEWGRLTLSEVLHTLPEAITVIISTERAGPRQFVFHFDDAEESKLDRIIITPVAGGEALDAQLAGQTVEALAEALAENYVFPDLGDQMAEMLRTGDASGSYADISGERQLAERLTSDLRAICADKHLTVRVAPARPDVPLRPAPINAGFRKVEILPGNIGYVRFDAFVAGEDAHRIAAAAMNFVASAEAVVFDLRHNGGGSPDTIRFITSYLFDEPTHLNSFYDREGNRTAEYWTLDEVPGRRLNPGAGVYILTSGSTFSGAEEFAYNLQALGRGRVVGETTGGGAHPQRIHRLNDRFVVSIPFARAHNPITGTNWEGTGVMPDIAVDAAEALDRAISDFTGEMPRALVMRVE